jgi:hypothetical protein
LADTGGYELSGDAIRRIFAVVRAWEASQGGDLSQGGDPMQPGGVIPQPPWRYGILDADLVADGSVVASIWRWDSVTSAWIDTGEDQEVFAPFAMEAGSLVAGTRIRFGYNTEASRFDVLQIGWRDLVRFILREELVAGGTARAEIFTLDEDGHHVFGAYGGEMITVFDPLCEFYGTPDVSTGIGYRMPDTPDLAIEEGDVTYEILRMTCPGFAGCPPVS